MTVFFYKADVEDFSIHTRFIACKDVLDKWEHHLERAELKNRLIAAHLVQGVIGEWKNLAIFDEKLVRIEDNGKELIVNERAIFKKDDIELLDRKWFPVVEVAPVEKLTKLTRRYQAFDTIFLEVIKECNGKCPRLYTFAMAVYEKLDPQLRPPTADTIERDIKAYFREQDTTYTRYVNNHFPKPKVF